MIQSTNAGAVSRMDQDDRLNRSGSSSYGSDGSQELEFSDDGNTTYSDTEPIISPRRVSYRQQFADFSNVLKAFIGASLIGLPFAIRNSGIALGIIGIIVIAMATDHCCHLIVKCKNFAIVKTCESLRESGLDDYSVDVERNYMGRTFSFGDIGKQAMGKGGTLAVNASVFITQLGFCIGYFVFLGNTIRQLLTDFFHKAPPTPMNITTAVPPFTTVPINTSVLTTMIPITTIINGSLLDNLYNASMLDVIDQSHPAVFSPTSLLENSTRTFALLLLIPGPMLILISYINNIRKLGPVSVMANGAILTAFLATAVYIIAEFQSPHSTIVYFNWQTFPVFFGQLTGAFEGIGTVIPIEGSMAENRRRYPVYLHISLTTVSIMLGSFGILGYLRYGEHISQIVTDNLSGSPIVSVLRILLFLGILFTYPLQIYPVIQLSEKWIFHSRTSCLYHPRRRPSNSAAEPLVENKDLPSLKVRKVPQWKRNILRTLIVCFTAVIAVFMRNQFAHVSALTGAIGSSLLSYILPCIFHLKLRKGELPWMIIIKDVFMIIFGIVGGTVGVSVTIIEIVKSMQKHADA